MEERTKRLAKNTIFLYVRMALSMLVSLYTSRVVLEVLGFADYGLYGVIGGLVSMFTFLNGAMSGATSRYIALELSRKNLDKLRKLFSTLFFSHVFIAIFVVIIAESIGLWFLDNKLVIPPGQKDIAFWVYQISIITTVLGITLVPYSAMIIAHENMRIYAYVGLAEVTFRLINVYLLMVLPGSKLLLWAILVLIVQVSVNTFYRIYVRRKYEGSNLYFPKDKALYKEIFGYVGNDMIGNISVLAQGQGLNILLNMFFGPTVNAARNLAYTVQGTTQQFSSNFMTAVRPQIIKMHGEENDPGMLKLMKSTSRMGFYLLLIIALPILINIEYILNIWLGKYPDFTIPFVRIILLISLIQTLKTPRTMVFHALGKLRLVNVVVGSMLIMTFPISYIILKWGAGPTSVFWISLIVILLTEIVSVWILKKYLNFNGSKYLLTVHARCILLGIVSAMLPLYLKYKFPEQEFLQVFFNSVVCLISIGVSILSFGINREERDKLVEMIKNKI